MVDKRKKPRRAVDCAVSISWRDDNGSRTTTGRALDVCDSGVRVELTCPIERSSQVRWENRNPGGPEAATAINGLGVLAQQMGQRVQAVTLFREAISRRRPDDDPLQLAQMMANLAAALDPDEAVAQYSEAIVLVENHGGAEHLMLVPLLDGQARCLRTLHRKREAHEVALRARRVRKANPMGFTIDQTALH